MRLFQTQYSPILQRHINANRPIVFFSKMCDWLGEAGGCVLGGPWRLTEPCDVTVGGATWLDQAQETAARTNQNAGPHRRKMGQQRAAPINWGGGRFQTGQERQKTAADPHRKGMGPEDCPSTAKKKIKRKKNVHTGPERKRRCKERQGRRG